MDEKQLLKPYMRQFYKGNGWRFALALAVTLVLTAATMMVSWLIQVIIDLATGAVVILHTVCGSILWIGIKSEGSFLGFSQPLFCTRFVAL